VGFSLGPEQATKANAVNTPITKLLIVAPLKKTQTNPHNCQFGIIIAICHRHGSSDSYLLFF
jgi:hypothetical protein